MSKIKELLKWRADRYNKMLERRKQNREKAADTEHRRSSNEDNTN